jgi:hypothetical protein
MWKSLKGLQYFSFQKFGRSKQQRREPIAVSILVSLSAILTDEAPACFGGFTSVSTKVLEINHLCLVEQAHKIWHSLCFFVIA